MNYAFLLAPAFMDWAIAVMTSIRAQDPGAQFVGLCSSTRAYEKVKKNWPDFFVALEDFESREKSWISDNATAINHDEKIAHYDQLLGPGVLQRIIVADRHLGAGYITGADPIHSRLFKATRERDALLRYLVRMMDYLDDFIVRNKLDCFFLYAVASGPLLAIGELCRVRGVRFLRLQTTRIGDGFIVDSSIKGLCAEISEVFQAADKNPALLNDYRVQAAQILESYRMRQVVPGYVTYSKNILKKAYSPLTLLKVTARAGAKIFLYPFLYGRPPVRAENHWGDFFRTFLKPVRFWVTRDCLPYIKLGALKERSFIYFPLHVDPEASTMVIAPGHTNQLAIIENISKNAPFNMPIVVKEHWPMVGIRPLWFYRRLRALPNVVLIDPYQSSVEIMKRCGMVVTITGTVGWEAMVFGRPALVIGESPFKDVGQGFVHYGDITALAETIQKVLQMPPAEDERLIRYIASALKVSFALPMKLLWGNPDAATIASHQHVTDRVAREIIAGAKK